MKRTSLVHFGTIIILFQLHFALFSQQFVPGNSYFGRNNYIEYVAGNLPVIISIPHGGNLTPGEISDRTCGENVTDSYTLNLGRELSDVITQLTGCYAHVIICHLKRTKLDANRELNIATCDDPVAGIAWEEYHKYIDSAKASITRTSGKGLLIDLHAHGHEIQRLEIGYLVSASQLRYADTVLIGTRYVDLSSIRNLVYSNLTNQSLTELLRGPQSLGGYLARAGYRSVPSYDEPYPLEGELYFSGGYITQRHGSRDGGKIDAIQIECNRDVRFDPVLRQTFAVNLGSVLLEYLGEHYFDNEVHQNGHK